MLIKDVFINGLSAISSQPTFDEAFLHSFILEQSAPYRKVIDPDYKQYLNPTASRRFSRLIKMSLVAAQKSVAMAGIEMPEAIITGTGMGCMEDTEKFLLSLIESEETLLSPTAFIQSTHNTISGQIAMMLKCNYPNYTYSNRQFSFESALLDGILMLNDKSCNTVMVHAADEIIPNVYSILKRMKLWDRDEYIQGNPSYKVTAGEGVVNLLLSSSQTPTTIARISGLKLYYILPDDSTIETVTKQFLSECNLTASDITAVIAGSNGEESDVYYEALSNALPNASIIAYKHLFGESFTASAFSYWLGAKLIHKKTVPEGCVIRNHPPSQFKHILLYNQFRGKYHSLCIVSDVEV